jgi:hypothetical protein
MLHQNRSTCVPSARRIEVLSRNAYRALVRPSKAFTPLWVGIVFDDNLGREHLDLTGVVFTPTVKEVNA